MSQENHGAIHSSTDADLAAIERRLRARRAELEQLAEAHEGERRPVELDQARIGRLSRMDALQEQAMALEIERRRALELARIDAALERVRRGAYGECVECGEPIARRRLALDPATPVCIDCAGRAE